MGIQTATINALDFDPELLHALAALPNREQFFPLRIDKIEERLRNLAAVLNREFFDSRFTSLPYNPSKDVFAFCWSSGVVSASSMIQRISDAIGARARVTFYFAKSRATLGFQVDYSTFEW